MLVQTCKYCRHSRLLVTPNGSGRSCVMNPPTAIGVGGPQGVQVMGAWPPVKDEDWCSKFEQDELLRRKEDAKSAIQTGLLKQN